MAPTYLPPDRRNAPHAAEWEAYLDYRCRWSPADFGPEWAWDREIPPRADWDRVTELFNVELARRERAEQCRPGDLFAGCEDYPTPLREG
jgi:hypothetical protein